MLLFYSLNVSDSESGITCSESIKTSEVLNSYDLWNGAGDCSKANLKLETNYLLLIGQIRAMTDMTVLEPISDEEGVKLSELYGILYYKTGGSGFEEIYRDPKSYEKLIKRIKNWNPTLSTEYAPGWIYKSNIDPSYYSKMTECQKIVRLSKLKWYSDLIQNNEYYELSKKLDKLKTDNPGAFKAGSEAYNSYQKLSAKMNAISSKIPIPSNNPKECSFIKPYEPDPNASFKQVFKGYNGPANSSAKAFSSDVELKESWVAKALNSTELKSILEKVDFNKQIVVALSFGKRETATGTIHISNVKYNTVYKSLTISGLIGVNQKDCTENRLESFPFALAIAERPQTISDHPGLSIHNFPDGCKKIVSGLSIESN